jgi:hypothetical protein
MSSDDPEYPNNFVKSDLVMAWMYNITNMNEEWLKRMISPQGFNI